MNQLKVTCPTIQRRFGRRWRLLVEMGMDVGLRSGEIYGQHTDRVDWDRGLVAVTRVMTRYGLREYPKSRRSHRVVPVPPATMQATALELGAGRRWSGKCTCPKVMPDGTTRPGEGSCGGLVFPAPMGGPIDDGNFRDRFWYPAVKAAGSAASPRRSCGTRRRAGS
ncbi:hypothetical protein [Thermomonospora umbrina]|uniref:hypothetical protein n=1 Tax=Thermomonospora umbrina TaxID=111806 RepID=UPI001B87BEFC|nr:hypothetical protein [Thermomonospora umbrina]